VRVTSGGTSTLLDTVTNVNCSVQAWGWQEYSYDLSAFKGRR
jgi:hypothetical protein